MADVKISGLPTSTTPLAGTEVLPIVQGGVTKQVANNDLRPKQIQSNATSGVLQIAGPASAATRVMTTPDANFTAARTDAAQTFTGTQTFSGLVAAPNIALTSAAFDGVSEIASRNNGASTGNRRSFWLQQGNGNFTGYMSWGVNGVTSDTDAVEGLRLSPLGLHIGPANNATVPLHIQNAASTSSVQNGIRLQSNAGVGETMQKIEWFHGAAGTAAYIDAIRSQAGFAGTLRFYTSINGSNTPTLALSINENQGIFASGLIYPQQATTAAAPAYVKGAIYFDTTLNKLRVGGATGWETITSV